MQKQTGFNEFIIIIIIIILKIIIFFHNNNNNNNNFLPLTTILALPLNFLITISELQAM
jgi:amino acid transporter